MDAFFLTTGVAIVGSRDRVFEAFFVVPDSAAAAAAAGRGCFTTGV
jgi:hypothetical protein